jgi:hypothetical protein
MPRALYIVKQFFPKVTKVNDASADLAIEVTKQDNKDSRVRDHNECAMAIACRRKFHADGVIISIDRAYIVKGNVATRYTLPESVRREIVSFDREAGFREGEYRLKAVARSVQLGEWRGEKTSDSSKSHSGGIKKRFTHITEGIRTALGSKNAPAGIQWAK